MSLVKDIFERDTKINQLKTKAGPMDTEKIEANKPIFPKTKEPTQEEKKILICRCGYKFATKPNTVDIKCPWCGANLRR